MSKLAALQKKYNELLKVNENLKSSNDTLKNISDNTSKNSHKVYNEYNNLQTKYDELKKNNDILHEVVKINDLQKECYELKKERDLLRNIVDKTKSGLEELSFYHKTDEELLSNIDYCFEEITRERELLKDEKDKLERQINSAYSALRGYDNNDY